MRPHEILPNIKVELVTNGLRIACVGMLLASFAIPVGVAAEFESSPDLSATPRVDVDKPVELVPLSERDPRIHHLIPFQKLVDATPAGGTLKPKPGTYAGPVLVDKPIVIDGAGKVTIDGGDKGTVFVLKANSSTIRGLHLTGSGSHHDTDDACINVRGNNNYIESLVIDNCLFGIDLKQSSNNVIRNNQIRSKPLELGVRGDGIRLWYSMNNRIEGNRVVDSRDNVAWYSNGNVFYRNYGTRSRYSIHFMFANNNVVDSNNFYDNAVGVYLMYNENTVVRNNIFSHSNGATGMAIGFKEASAVQIENNEIIYCAIGIGSDLSPFQPGTTIQVKGNRFAYNGIAIAFNSDRDGHYFLKNIFEGNLTDVSVGGAGSAKRNVWRGNYWDDYQGFDRNNDGVGDTPYKLHAYADRIWMEVPHARFFKNAPLMEAIDFLERLAPFSDPELILHDDAPMFHLPRKARK
ncbi:periplasmic copper-binding [Sulfuricella denitrificans skB26]|uniref:Periplasmic copper-binding n=2 Tax=Sulfuricella denitrificans TaxID=649841 RepID=S6B0G6_SULDS|nr:periplasmic copper-binding [Sulfuricella denitrificans skB26]